MKALKGAVAHGAVVALGLIPLVWLGFDAFGDRLGANPIEELTHRTGDWTIRFLLAALAVTPLRRLTGWNGLIRFRRTIGLLAFGYVCVHFLIYIGLDQGLAFSYIGEDIAKRPYITVGFAAFVLLIPLAITSTRGWVRRLGGRRWNALHRLIYVAAAGGVLHYLWLVKGDQVTPVYYAAVLVVLLALRVRRGPVRTPAGARAPARDARRPEGRFPAPPPEPVRDPS
ncbi:MAG: protein-methionine-sulfoxide reductase heme-binding subunit MsrQ [Gemmatimonadales bacterium]